MAKLTGTTFMLGWEDDDGWTEHVATARCVSVGFEERAFPWTILQILNKIAQARYASPYAFNLYDLALRHFLLS